MIIPPSWSCSFTWLYWQHPGSLWVQFLNVPPFSLMCENMKLLPKHRHSKPCWDIHVGLAAVGLHLWETHLLLEEHTPQEHVKHDSELLYSGTFISPILFINLFNQKIMGKLKCVPEVKSVIRLSNTVWSNMHTIDTITMQHAEKKRGYIRSKVCDFCVETRAFLSHF